MTEDEPKHHDGEVNDHNDRVLPPAAKRALEEADARRKAREKAVLNKKGAPGAGQKEINGPKGPEPVRYGDWENKGRASDF